MDEKRWRPALGELLAQLADDDLVTAFRASEWLGLAPHLEEDVAWSSIAQDEMGHAAMYFSLLEQLGFGSADDLAHLRGPADRRNSVLLERPNGPGTYLDQPRFDWAYALARQYLYDTLEALRLDGLVESSYRPLAELAAKIRREERYHALHHATWLEEVAQAGGEASERLRHAFVRAAADAGDLAYTSGWAREWEESGLWPDASELPAAWAHQVERELSHWGLVLPPVASVHNGRAGEHSPDLASVIAQLSDVYRTDPVASW